MNIDLSQQLQKYRQEINSKFKQKQILAQTIFKLASQSNKKDNVNLATLKQDLGRQRTKQRTSVTNFQGSPLKNMIRQNQSPNAQMRNEFNSSKFISPMRSMSQFKQSPKQSKFQIPTPRDANQTQSAVKLYSSKYQKVLPSEQGNYYSQLQAKLDGLAQLIGSEEDYHQNAKDVENVIEETINNFHNSNKQNKFDQIKSQQQVLEQDLKQLTFKISRFNVYKD
ncbi:unnamed protein product (macronuclear) [Paramecium tetraurelia]|uniref:Uncharacterized protein n=2 Tax=Paramecium TaxID=5884 RepID=A0CN19_PARTE|nr:uncharacterized protein GSPATT00008627001 [Paramecium tetraurelia]CAD8158844.1 unnamed protein product [Paramecium octaurelia]CAK72186.1 unnamed protein product [Paramecium tetraurelia]|eukprot:XP_001439583.1 hypothetical protein (macronuclear) [Paramecium tetraurelia strain d4-2]